MLKNSRPSSDPVLATVRAGHSWGVDGDPPAGAPRGSPPTHEAGTGVQASGQLVTLG